MYATALFTIAKKVETAQGAIRNECLGQSGLFFLKTYLSF